MVLYLFIWPIYTFDRPLTHLCRSCHWPRGCSNFWSSRTGEKMDKKQRGKPPCSSVPMSQVVQNTVFFSRFFLTNLFDSRIFRGSLWFTAFGMTGLKPSPSGSHGSHGSSRNAGVVWAKSAVASSWLMLVGFVSGIRKIECGMEKHQASILGETKRYAVSNLVRKQFSPRINGWFLCKPSDLEKSVHHPIPADSFAESFHCHRIPIESWAISAEQKEIVQTLVTACDISESSLRCCPWHETHPNVLLPSPIFSLSHFGMTFWSSTDQQTSQIIVCLDMMILEASSEMTLNISEHLWTPWAPWAPTPMIVI